MPSRRALAGCCLALILLSMGTVRGAQAPPVTEATLDNGLRILILEDHRNPIATVQTWYRVGARNEIPGATGLAHFLEHMMFKGTPTYGKGQLAQVVEENGGQDNAFTSHDVTTYYVNIAADRVDLVLGLEADRMRNLLLDPQEIESERQGAAEPHRGRSRRLSLGGVPRCRLQGASLWLARDRVDERHPAHQRGRAARLLRPLLRSRQRASRGGGRRGPAAGDRPGPRDLRQACARRRAAAHELRGASPGWRAPGARLQARRAGRYRVHRLPRAQLCLRRCARPRAALDHPPGRPRLAAVPAARLRAAARPQRGRRLYLSLARSQPLLVLGDAPARTQRRGARARHHGRDRAREEPARAGGGARASQEPNRGGLRLAPGLDLLARVDPGALRDVRHVAEQRVLRSPHSWSDRRRSAARGAHVLPAPLPHGGHPPARRPARRHGTVTAMSWRWPRGALALLLIAALFVAAAWAGRQLGTGNGAPVSVTGTIEATQVDVSVKITGRILERLVNEGDKVTRGQPLVRLDDSELAADVRRLEASLRSAQATLRDLEKGARPQEIEDARAAVSSSEATRSMTEREFQRTDQLFKQNLIAAQDVDRARQAFDVARAQERSAREKLALLLEGSRPDQIDAARWQVSQAESALVQAQSRLREAMVVSPIDGVVLRKNLEAGETANPGVPILTLVNPKDVWLRAYVPETEVGRLKVGDTAKLRVDAFPDRVFSGRLTEIGSEAEYTPRNVQTKKERVNLVFRIKIQIDNPQGILKPGLPADADVG